MIRVVALTTPETDDSLEYRTVKVVQFSDYLEAVPPSTGKSIPVMKLLSSEARNTAAAARSSAVPSGPIGIIFRKYSLVPSGDPLEPIWIMGVSVGPGLITFARIPRLANSAVQVRTKETNAAFVAE